MAGHLAILKFTCDWMGKNFFYFFYFLLVEDDD